MERDVYKAPDSKISRARNGKETQRRVAASGPLSSPRSSLPVQNHRRRPGFNKPPSRGMRLVATRLDATQSAIGIGSTPPIPPRSLSCPCLVPRKLDQSAPDR